ncbi:calcium-binding protein [Nostoc sp. DedQUE09]|uniref:calcium-binding protein n=1 Tax=Nostoc sp. DedQUE09 TaxID=3075394 RepID=UPI002AD4F783|nr:M10 family metallopeptidase C-terminal domain-containing protein [Nostoc sp. DedQUE09]MDZ7951411.1 M10 family metallopeptidase C-terminal domain-containing protein [Nostoc sp. DedQUE09]
MANPVFTDIFDSNLNDNNTTTGTNLDDVILGDNGNDILTGLAGNDLLFGNNGNDTINGGLGNDIINGGNGNDILIGGAGTDTITDGDGDDIYKYFSTSESQVGVTRDILTDFTSGFDKIDLSAIDAELLTAGDQAFKFIGTAAFTGTAGEVRYFTSGSNLFVQAEINNDGNITADLEIQLNGVATIAATSFIL